MEPQPGRQSEDPQTDQQTGVKLEKLGNEIEEGTAELAGGVGQLALGMASLFARVFSVNPDNSQTPPVETQDEI